MKGRNEGMCRLDALLVARRLTKHFGEIKALEAFSCQIREAEIVALVGPNGSGKTTFFNLISRIWHESAGDLLFGDAKISLRHKVPSEVMRLGIARTFQEPRLFWHMSVIENLLIGYDNQLRSGVFKGLLNLKSYRQEHEGALEVCHRCLAVFGERLLPREYDPAYSLSYANRRRLEIARALASQPKLLLLDEPVAGMNPTESQELMGLLTKIRDSGITIVFIEHNMDAVKSVAERVIFLSEGRKIAEGSFDKVAENEEVVEAYLGRKVDAS